MKINLSEIESRLQSFIEGSLSAASLNKHKNQIVPLLISSIQKEILQDVSGDLIAPSQLIIFTHPKSYSSWQASLPALEDLAVILQDACSQAGIKFLQSPSVSLASAPELGEDEIRVVSVFPQTELLSETTAVEPQASRIVTEDKKTPVNAFLILDGNHLFNLNQKVVNLGRRGDNQIVFQDPRVSRLHAQLRLVRNKYILFDLNSSGGSFVNGQRINQAVLKPGDVISLAGVTIIYGEESTQTGETSSRKTQTSELKGPS